MKKYCFFVLCSFLCAFNVPARDASQIADKIWKNECAGTVEGLTCWNKGENFPSLGIGHFIWYQADKKEHFEETFPALLKYLEQEKVLLPAWLKNAQGEIRSAPWSSREEFYQKIQSTEMRSLRQLLIATKNHQAIFIVKRIEKTLPQMVEKVPVQEREKVVSLFNRLANDPRGLYALIDYVNFKGTGISSKETYKNKGWGLLQVLQSIPVTSEDVVEDFVHSAKDVLHERVKNSPPERNEEKWLKGWINRVNTYLTLT